MNNTAQLARHLRGILTQPAGGIVGLVDDLLGVCLEHGLQLEWQADRCLFRPPRGDWEELTDVTLRTSVFRAILARVAALCNERAPNSVSPYGEQGELSSGGNPGAVFRVTFLNTPTTQKLELLAPAEKPAETGHRGQVAS
jgi:hypothetical protein